MKEARAVRGGGFYNEAGYCRSSYRSYNSPGNQFDGLGFRVVLFSPQRPLPSSALPSNRLPSSS
jgi:hypothetical protein